MADLDIELEDQAAVVLDIEGNITFPLNVVGGNGIAVTRDGTDLVITNVEGPLPGPQGDPGPAGPTGATGATGAAGPAGAAATTVTGAAVGSAYAEYTANANLTAILPFDDTIPQVTEGTQILSATITPKATTNKIRGQISLVGSCATAGDALSAAVFVNGAANAIRSGYIVTPISGGFEVLSLAFEHSPGSVSAQTYTVRVGGSSGAAWRLNGGTATRLGGGAVAATLLLQEIVA